MSKNTLLFVTGAPRSGTTPVGEVLSQGVCNAVLYEPFGPTGTVENSEKFPIIDVNISAEQIDKILGDISSLRMRLKPQYRQSHKNISFLKKVGLSTVGTQTKQSLLKAKLTSPVVKNIIVKDPHLAFSAKDLARKDHSVVITHRPALAQAASYKRLAWEPNVARYIQTMKKIWCCSSN